MCETERGKGREDITGVVGLDSSASRLANYLEQGRGRSGGRSGGGEVGVRWVRREEWRSVEIGWEGEMERGES